MNFGEKLRDILDDRDIPQIDFAKILSIAPSTLNGYIKGNRMPDMAMILAISNALDVSTDYLFDRGGNSKFSTALTSLEYNLLQDFRCLEKSQKELVIGQIGIMKMQNKRSSK